MVSTLFLWMVIHQSRHYIPMNHQLVKSLVTAKTDADMRFFPRSTSGILLFDLFGDYSGYYIYIIYTMVRYTMVIDILWLYIYTMVIYMESCIYIYILIHICRYSHWDEQLFG